MLNPHERIDVAASMQTFKGQHGGFRQEFMGVPLWKTQADLLRYETAARRCKPDIIIETGTLWGGSALWFAAMLGVKVLTIDNTPAVTPHTIALAEEQDVTFMRGNSTADHTFERVHAWLPPGKRVMVSLDADHHRPHVKSEIIRYGALVTGGCYLVVEDGIADLAPDVPGITGARNIGADIPDIGGPLQAIEDTLANDSKWERDLEIEGMSHITHHPAGWWRRV